MENHSNGSSATEASSTEANKWSSDTQTPHGGQEWRAMSNFVEDFSVTTNPLGTPKGALEATIAAMADIQHYPSADYEPAWTDIADFIASEPHVVQNGGSSSNQLKRRLILGNGASELIDLCSRIQPGESWRPGPFTTQYMEYERSAINDGRKKCAWNDKSSHYWCMVNPCNPTGDFLRLKEMKELIQRNSEEGTLIVVDESMLPWIGRHWRSESLTSEGDWISTLAIEKSIRIFIVHSWTKLWACPGLRIGTVLAPTVEDARNVWMKKAPWSLNTMAIAFISAVVKDTKYLEETWRVTSKWREYIRQGIAAAHPEWLIQGVSWQTFLWIDTKSGDVAEYYTTICHLRGVPIRWGKHGYGMPTYIRVGVRKQPEADVLLEALSSPINGL